ncbi:Retrovirus-related Pol polyprotein from transposon TNT 1-94-like protein [Drosera capensis]
MDYEFVTLSEGSKPVGCKWVLRIKEEAYDIDLENMDVKIAFLYGYLEKTIYMDQESDKEGLVCRLKRSLYSLKELSTRWYKRFNGFMVTHGYSRNMYNNLGNQPGPGVPQQGYYVPPNPFENGLYGAGSGLIRSGLGAYGEKILGSSSEYVQSNVSSMR